MHSLSVSERQKACNPTSGQGVMFQIARVGVLVPNSEGLYEG
jgi:hypothetical protein